MVRIAADLQPVEGTTATFSLRPETDDVYTVIAEGDTPMGGVWGDETPWALASPIYVDVTGDANPDMRIYLLKVSGLTEDDWEEQLLAVMRSAVRRRMVADVPVGVLLSGGVDSMTLSSFAHNALGAGRVGMVHAVSPAVPPAATQRVRAQASVEGWKLRIVDAGEILDFASAGFLVKSLGVACFTDLERSVHEDLHKIAWFTGGDDLLTNRVSVCRSATMRWTVSGRPRPLICRAPMVSTSKASPSSFRVAASVVAWAALR